MIAFGGLVAAQIAPRDRRVRDHRQAPHDERRDDVHVRVKRIDNVEVTMNRSWAQVPQAHVRDAAVAGRRPGERARLTDTAVSDGTRLVQW